MRLSNKHANVQTVSFSDFSGGLNTTDAAETIAENELSRAVNVEIYKGQLKTVAGTTRVYYQEDGDFTDMVFDSMSNTFLLIDVDRNVYALVQGELVAKGTLTGNSSVQYASWEDGVLIASGGKLQYYHRGTLETIDTSPSVCHGVFIKQGRVWVYYDDILYCSGVGDETQWTHDSNDESKAQWLQIGYKDGGFIVGVTSLLSDTIILKSNRYAYHLAGEYPNWTVSEISRQLDCKYYNACVALANNTIVLGSSKVQAITATDTYGDMQSSDLSAKIYGDIISLPPKVKLRYISQLNQIWFLQRNKNFLFLDVNTGGWFKRQFFNTAIDALEANGSIFVLKATGLYMLDSSNMKDDGEELPWYFQAKTLVSDNRFLIKKVQVDTTPFDIKRRDDYIGAVFHVGHVALDTSKSYKPANIVFTNSEEIFENPEMIFESPIPLMSLDMYRAETRCCDNLKAIKVISRGTGHVIVFDRISFDVAEV